jgi:hypothetical protein
MGRAGHAGGLGSAGGQPAAHPEPAAAVAADEGGAGHGCRGVAEGPRAAVQGRRQGRQAGRQARQAPARRAAAIAGARGRVRPALPAAVPRAPPWAGCSSPPAFCLAREARPGAQAGRRRAESLFPAAGGPGWEAAAGGGPPEPGPCHLLSLTPCAARGLLSGRPPRACCSALKSVPVQRAATSLLLC